MNNNTIELEISNDITLYGINEIDASAVIERTKEYTGNAIDLRRLADEVSYHRSRMNKDNN